MLGVLLAVLLRQVCQAHLHFGLDDAVAQAVDLLHQVDHNFQVWIFVELGHLADCVGCRGW